MYINNIAWEKGKCKKKGIKMVKKSKIIDREEIASGKFIKLERVRFEDERGRLRSWDAAERVNSQGAVMIIGHLMPSNRVLLVRQFRPPTGKYVIEFPAGLIDAGESAENTAHRELLEETGYRGMLSFCSAPAYSSSGLTGESISVAIVEINDFEFENTPPVAQPEDSESIEIFTVKMTELKRFINKAIDSGDGVDTKVLMFMMAQEYFHG